MLTNRNPEDTVYENLFFGYSEMYEHDEYARRRWQAALVLADLGTAAVTDRFRYHFCVAEDDPVSGLFMNTVKQDVRGPIEIPGIVAGDQAVVRPDGTIHVEVQGLIVSPSKSYE